MANKTNETKTNEEVVVNEVNSTELGTVEVVTKEAKKFKCPTWLKGLGIFVGGLTIGALCGYSKGSKSSKNDEYYDTEVVEGEIVDSDIE